PEAGVVPNAAGHGVEVVLLQVEVLRCALAEGAARREEPERREDRHRAQPDQPPTPTGTAQRARPALEATSTGHLLVGLGQRWVVDPQDGQIGPLEARDDARGQADLGEAG